MSKFQIRYAVVIRNNMKEKDRKDSRCDGSNFYSWGRTKISNFITDYKHFANGKDKWQKFPKSAVSEIAVDYRRGEVKESYVKVNAHSTTIRVQNINYVRSTAVDTTSWVESGTGDVMTLHDQFDKDALKRKSSFKWLSSYFAKAGLTGIHRKLGGVYSDRYILSQLQKTWKDLTEDDYQLGLAQCRSCLFHMWGTSSGSCSSAVGAKSTKKRLSFPQ
jgi:hypothetical protein